ncbi:hypothetical protein KP79_PYT14452 [Mizuhopecten yessoensis]|uniref:Transposase Tc1-like domain-containing protein n=1 Tax=Mizuhopecten yessoensis TaxID=6573 RepID=A0A210QHI7_MIZYE|nr:hypothetical protein KP79_PYT14452 [Mizuhopecten yessoensis]
MADLRRRRLSVEAKLKIMSMKSKTGGQITKILKEKYGILTTRKTVNIYRKRLSNGETLDRKRCFSSIKNSKVKPIHKKIINMWLSRNSELTSPEIQRKFHSSFGLTVSTAHTRRIRRELGWTARHIKYCQLISNKNKFFCLVNRYNFCINTLISLETFSNVIFVDETSVEMSSNGRMFFTQHGPSMDRLPSKAPKPKHAYKVK